MMKKNIKYNLGPESALLFVSSRIVVDASTKTLPTEIDALIEGDHGNKVMLDGSLKHVVITKADIDAAVAFVKERRQSEPNREYVIDYDHQTIYGPPPAVAAGWWNDLNRIERDGFAVARASVASWTPRASEIILNGEMRYISPVFRQNSYDDFGKFQKCMIFNMGLLNEPFLKNMMPVAASKYFNTIIGEGNNMEELLERLRYFLNAQTTATPEELLADLKKLVGQIGEFVNSKAEEVTASKILTFLTSSKPVIAASNGLTQFRNDVIAKLALTPAAKDEEMLAIIASAKVNAEQLVTVTKELSTLKDADFEKNFNATLAKSVAAGRLLPVQMKDEKWIAAQKDWAKKDFPGFETYFCSSAPVVGPVTKLPEINGNGGISDSENPTVIANAAIAYQKQQKDSGVEISISAAVAHVMKK